MAADRETCSSGCPRPPELPWPVRAAWRAWDLITWPATARQLRRAGFRHTGFMTWESGPEPGLDLAACPKCGTAGCLEDAGLQDI